MPSEPPARSAWHRSARHSGRASGNDRRHTSCGRRSSHASRVSAAPRRTPRPGSMGGIADFGRRATIVRLQSVTQQRDRLQKHEPILPRRARTAARASSRRSAAVRSRGNRPRRRCASRPRRQGPVGGERLGHRSSPASSTGCDHSTRPAAVNSVSTSATGKLDQQLIVRTAARPRQQGNASRIGRSSRGGRFSLNSSSRPHSLAAGAGVVPVANVVRIDMLCRRSGSGCRWRSDGGRENRSGEMASRSRQCSFAGRGAAEGILFASRVRQRFAVHSLCINSEDDCLPISIPLEATRVAENSNLKF